APILHHHKTKFKFNALTMWAIEKDHISDVADYLVQFQHISHVYERATYPEWPYTLYGMLHAESMEDIEVLVRQILAKTGDVAYKVVFTTNEWKKTSPDLGYLLRKTVDL
ncbi:MAG: hypothetical protein JXO44_00240, partial [Clostridia bacterium]|nr:hypothetical protein [Clostridia bacterium]